MTYQFRERDHLHINNYTFCDRKSITLRAGRCKAPALAFNMLPFQFAHYSGYTAPDKNNGIVFVLLEAAYQSADNRQYVVL